MTDTVGTLLAAAVGRAPRSDARLVLAHLLKTTKERLIMHPELEVAPEVKAAYLEALEKISRGCPVAYVTGVREFYGRPFAVTPDVLVPRPDTETLVEEAIALIKREGAKSALDLGTGSGIIAVTLALEAPETTVTATDESPAALAVARGNAQRLGARVSFFEGSWFDALAQEGAPQSFNLIVSNPPYIDPADSHMAALSFEPRGALTDEVDGLQDLKAIIERAPQHLAAGGVLLLEHGYDQGEAVRAMLSAAGFEDVRTVQDLAGNDRVSGGRRRP